MNLEIVGHSMMQDIPQCDIIHKCEWDFSYVYRSVAAHDAQYRYKEYIPTILGCVPQIIY